MHSVTLFPRTILLELDALSGILLVLYGNVVLAFALRAGEGDVDSHGTTR